MTEDHGPASPSQDVSLRPSKAHVARHKTLTSFMVKEMDKPRTDAQDYVVSQRYTKRWSPFWLRRTTLIGFIAAYVVLAGALLALWLADRSGNGFSIGNSPQYAWTYGPTAVLVVIISFWRRVDYQCKLLQPWIALHKGPASAERSVLLDYVSPIQFTSLARAIRHRHYVVVASIIGFALLKLIVLFSTGLLVLSPTEMDGVFPAVLGTNFNGSDFWPSIQYPGIQNGYSGQSLFYVPAYSNVGGASVQAFLGTLSGMATPENIVGNNTFQSFELTENTAAQEISAKVDVFEPRSSCEIAQPNITSKYIDILNVTLRSKTCSVGFGEQETITPDFMGGSNCSSKACIVPVPLYSMMRVNCSNLETGSSGITYLGPNVQATSQSYPVDVDINLSTAAICKIDYALESSTVHHDWKTDSFTIGSSTQDRRLEELTGVMLGEIMFAALAEADNLLLDFAVPPTSSLFSVMLQTLSGEQSLQRLLDAETLQRAATFSLAGIATHFMQQSYLLHSNITSAASVTYVEQRLHVGMTSMILMVVGFFLLVLCTMCVDLIQRKVLLPRNPDSIATSLMVLRTSDNFRSLLREAGRLRTSRLIALLRDYRFKIKIGATLQIESILAEVATEKTAPKTKQYAWMPFAATHTAVGLMLITPTAALLALEVLARLSEAEHGIVDVSTQELTAAVSSRYITALIMLLIATCFGSFDFVVSSFAPFSLLRKGTVPASRVAFSALVGSMPPIALVQSLRMRHYASMLSNMAAMTGGVLTIVASGLFFRGPQCLYSTSVRGALHRQLECYMGQLFFERRLRRRYRA
ncbi:hypothetical protein DOTSEDRAFT_56418 [Dothistroma septosporum NZE10]|uniref:Uncharacterized protein n=1 Tax=Dothistroma septosporum (strain NZE10 / CBS 128990) TaxID=675120 RepID=N1PCX0_DOTSN|nr:hypothetical protein DOTSEDRAFT_56418 [Dothistroma septosporum NZE10]